MKISFNGFLGKCTVQLRYCIPEPKYMCNSPQPNMSIHVCTVCMCVRIYGICAYVLLVYELKYCFFFS